MTIPTDISPIALFQDWLALAKEKEPYNYEAAALATADRSGAPSLRMVLLKGVDERGFVFYTNSESRKGRETAERPRAALCFYWKALKRQVRIEGEVRPVSAAEADAYFASRPREARIGAWASDQSRPMHGPLELEIRVAKFALKFGLGEVPRPPHWTGYRVAPERIEFWQERPFRLHERIVYHAENGTWRTERLFP